MGPSCACDLSRLTGAGPVGGRAANRVIRDDSQRPPRVSPNPLDGRAKEELLITFRRKSKSIGLLRTPGSFVSTAVSASKDLCTLGRRRAVRGQPQPIIRAATFESLHGAVDKATPASGIGVIRSRRDSKRNAGGSLARRRVVSQGRGRTSTGRALHAPAPSLVRPVWLIGRAGARLARRGQRHRHEFGALGRSPSRRWGVIESSWSFRMSRSGEGSFGTGGCLGPFAANGGKAHVPSSPVWATGQATRRWAAVIRTSQISGPLRRQSLIRAAVQQRIAAVERRSSTLGHARTRPCANQPAA